MDATKPIVVQARESPMLPVANVFLTFPKVWIGSRSGSLHSLLYPPTTTDGPAFISVPWWPHCTTLPLGEFCDCSGVTLLLRTQA